MKGRHRWVYILWIVFLLLVLVCGVALLLNGAVWNALRIDALDAGEAAALRLLVA